MGYRCPVCEGPQRDGEHLANHLAFTAMLRNDEHEAWLDEHAEGWADDSPADLAPRVTDHAEAAEFPQVFEDTASSVADGGRHDHAGGDCGCGCGHGADQSGVSAGIDDGDLDPETRAVLEEARDMTRRHRDDADGETE